MRGRDDFNKKGNAIMDTMDMYGMMKRSQLEAMFPGHEKIINYLIKNKRLLPLVGGAYIGQDETAEPNKYLITTIGVLIDVISKVTYHTTGNFPVQVIFTTIGGDYYEIIYAEQGNEALIAAAFKTQGVEHGIHDTTKRLVIIEDMAQIEKVKCAIPNIVRFVLANDDGFKYFTNS